MAQPRSSSHSRDGHGQAGSKLPVVEKILNHTSGSFGGVVGIYQRYSFAQEKRAALELWGEYTQLSLPINRKGEVKG
jgi:hypothetical protein